MKLLDLRKQINFLGFKTQIFLHGDITGKISYNLFADIIEKYDVKILTTIAKYNTVILKVKKI